MLESPAALLDSPAEGMPSPVPDFVDAARLEFQATLQLLAERACFLTAAEGCAVALQADGAIRFCAISGASERELGSEVALDVTGLHECVQTCQLDDCETATPRFTLVVPVLREGRPLGLLELVSPYEFLREVEPEMLRLADLVSIAWELRDAAEHGPEQILHAGVKAPLPVLWHAPEEADRRATETSPAAVAVAKPTDIRTCSSCGFPVSPGRTLCVECDQKPEAARSAPAQLFAPEPQESWWSAHGYTIASLLVTALTAALIVWLRR